MTATANARPRPKGGVGTTEDPTPCLCPGGEIPKIFIVLKVGFEP